MLLLQYPVMLTSSFNLLIYTFDKFQTLFTDSYRKNSGNQVSAVTQRRLL